MADFRYYRDGAADEWFARLMLGLAATLDVKISEERIRTWAKLLSDVDREPLAAAFARAANERTSTFYPTIGEIRRFVAPSEDEAALLAWSRFARAAEDVGRYMDVLVDDACAADALLTVFGSWPAYCDVDEGPGLGARKAEFVAAYRQARRDYRIATPSPVRLDGLCSLAGESSADGRTWVGRITADGVETRRRTQALVGDADGHAGEGPALPEGRGADDDEGPGASPREGGRP